MPTTPPLISIDEIREEIADLETPEERMGYLIELGQLLPAFPKDLQIEAHRVLGCQSMVWVVPESKDHAIYFRGTSDAPMVRGLVAILMSVYSGRTAQEIVDFPIQEFFEELKLKSFLTPMRSNGLHSMVLRIQSIAREQLVDHATLPMPDGMRSVHTVDGSPNLESDPSANTRPSRNIANCRQDFPILMQDLPGGFQPAYLDNAASSQRPVSVIDCMNEVYRSFYANVHRSGHDFAAQSTHAMEAAREAIGRFVHAESNQQVIFTSGTTASINLVARSWGDTCVQAGDEILLTEMEHHSNIVPWQQLAARVGAKIRWLPVREDYHLDLDALPKYLTSKTRLVAITAVSNVLGTINPVRTIVDAAHQVGAKVLVDAAQAVPHGSIDMRAWDADWIVFSGHKMLGPTGIGVLAGKRETLEAMPPFLGGGNMIQSVSKNGFEPAGLPHRFEAGTAPIVEAIAMKPAIEYLLSFGSEAILAHERRLCQRALDGLSAIPKLHVLGPSMQDKAGILSFAAHGTHPDQIGQYLNALGISVRVGHHCAMPLHERFGLAATARASFYLYNTDDDVDRFVNAVDRALKIGK